MVPGTQRTVFCHVSLDLKAGQGLALLGASAAGKSSLAKALVGIWPAATGVVRLDGAPIDRWHSDDLGRYIGYLPQDVGLFDGRWRRTSRVSTRQRHQTQFWRRPDCRALTR